MGRCAALLLLLLLLVLPPLSVRSAKQDDDHDAANDDAAARLQCAETSALPKQPSLWMNSVAGQVEQPHLTVTTGA